MNILFVGMKPSDELERALLANGFAFKLAKKIPTVQDTNSPYGLIAVKAKTVATLKELKIVRNAYPLAWVAVVIEAKWLKDSAKVNDLLRCADKNEIWIESIWERTLWFSMQSALNHHAALEDLTRLKEEREGLRKQYEELNQHTRVLVKQLERDVALATNIQRSLLPKISPEIPGVSLAVKYVPAAGIGGDYYDIFEFGDRKRFGILIADAKTHGMAAALLSVLVKVRLEEMKDLFPDSKSFVDHLNREIQRMHEKDMASLSLLYGILDRSSLTFQYTVAGPLRPLLWREGEAPVLSGATDPPLGGMDHYNFREHVIRLQPGDLLVLHTDGLEGPLQGNAFGKITQLLASSNPKADPQELQNDLMALIDRHTENEALKDDVTVIELAIHERAMYLASSGKE
jgi:serine phosphatase RsbU (regulator of sigma subunit)